MADHQPFPPGARRVARPAAVSPCPSCGDLAGRGYPECRYCAELVDQYWLLDWQELLAAEKLTEGGAGERELAELVLADEVGRHPWTCTDWAMTLVSCSQCGVEPGTGPVDCVRCAMAEGLRWSWDHAGFPDAITAGEHALRVARAVLRAPHRRRPTVVRAWRLLLPFLLVGELPTVGQVQRIRAHVIAGGYADLAGCTSHVELAGFPEVPWRRSARVEHQSKAQRDQDAAGDPLESPAHPRTGEPAADPV
ncbi:hypothetical protein FHS29_003174 [Saccharothrix tamanrassetensis]|uniref:Uncharacterized protein n=1 Tax=Saccharothrix tamanrassetensis TaxID=1051531 RepID=A0A841CK80_9PSEU|nr:hypothetical protein [Saccharothrix tamanrassetensis]MBB5956588.1 hypothetical protein [Saccharothrix tamanrassetensis]